MAGFEAKSLAFCGKFFGYEFRKCGPNEMGLSDAAVGRLQTAWSKVAGKKNALPELTDEQKQEVAKTLGEILTEAYKSKLASKSKEELHFVEFRQYDPKGRWAVKRVLFLPREASTVAQRLQRVGLSVASKAGGFVVSAGMGLLDVDVLRGVATMHQNYLDAKKNPTGVIDPLRDNVNTRRMLRELENDI